MCGNRRHLHIMPNNMHTVLDLQMLFNQDMQIRSHDILREHGLILCRFRTVTSSTVVRSDNMVTGVRNRSNHPSELVPGLRKAVNEQNGAFRFRLFWWQARSIVDPDTVLTAGV